MHMKYLLISDAARVAECVLAFDPRKEQRNGEQEEKLQPLFAILTKKQRFGAFLQTICQLSWRCWEGTGWLVEAVQEG